MFKFFQLIFILLIKPINVNLIRNFYMYFWVWTFFKLTKIKYYNSLPILFLNKVKFLSINSPLLKKALPK